MCVQAGRLASRDAVVSIGGSGEATVSASKTLNLSVAGSGDIGYYGDPKVSQNIRGSGTIKRLGAEIVGHQHGGSSVEGEGRREHAAVADRHQVLEPVGVFAAQLHEGIDAVG